MAFHGVPTVGITTNTNWNWNTLTTQSFSISTAAPAAIQINNTSNGDPVLKIHQDGRIEYSCKPSAAAESFIKALGGNIDLKAAGKIALEKTYRRAIQRCLNQAKSMSHEEFISMLENELDTRTSKAVVMRLQESIESDNI